jgi:hypothetical protein
MSAGGASARFCSWFVVPCRWLVDAWALLSERELMLWAKMPSDERLLLPWRLRLGTIAVPGDGTVGAVGPGASAVGLGLGEVCFEVRFPISSKLFDSHPF